MVAGELLNHLRLDHIVGRSEGNMVDGTGPLRATRKVACLVNINNSAERRVANPVADC